MQRISLEPIFILHSRPFRDTSLILDCLTQRYGRISAIARSARGLKSRYRGMLQLFSPLLASWTGNRELKNLGTVERQGSICRLDGRRLVCAFYLNELLQRLLQRDDPHPEIYKLYQSTLSQLENKTDPRAALRCFEKYLLQSLGYGLPLHYDVQSRDAITAEAYYQFVPDHGFLRCELDRRNQFIFSGKTLLALAKESFDDSTLLESRRLLHIALNQYLGHKPIKSRELLG